MSIPTLAVVLLCASASASASGPPQVEEWIIQERIDVRPDGQASISSHPLGFASISDDGRWVIFESRKDDLVADDTNGFNDVFVRDRVTQTTRRLSLLANGSQAAYGGGQPHASRDGRFVSFHSAAGLVAEDTNSKTDVYLLDRDADGNGVFDEIGATTLRRISVDAAGNKISIQARFASLSFERLSA